MIEICLDASQLETIEPCPRKWYYSYALNLIPNQSKRYFDVGSYYHEVLARYYGLPLTGIKDLTERLRQSLAFASESDLLRKFHIKDLDEQKFHRQRLLDYFATYMGEDEKMEPIAVEQGFSYLLYEDDSRRYILEGKIDLINKMMPYGLNVMDHKTQSRKDDRWEFNHQVCNYMSFMESCGTPANYFIYNYLGLQDKIPPQGIRRVIYKPHPGMLDQWKKEVKLTFDAMYHARLQAESMHQDGNFNILAEADLYERRRSACDASKYGLCTYHKLCSVPDGSKWVPAVFSAYKEKEEKWLAWSAKDKNES